MYDSVNPEAIPKTATRVCLYFNGRFAADPAVWGSRWPRVYWIDVLNNAPADASILDIETGDATPEDVPGWCERRLAAHPGSFCRLYCNLSTWPAVKANVAKLTSGRSQVRYWIANPTGTYHVVPGSDATQYLWLPNVDRSAVLDTWDN